jgi:hypothetical protein
MNRNDFDPNKHFHFRIGNGWMYAIYPNTDMVRCLSVTKQYRLSIEQARDAGIFELPISHNKRMFSELLDQHYKNNDYKFFIGDEEYCTVSDAINPDDVTVGSTFSHQGQRWVISNKLGNLYEICRTTKNGKLFSKKTTLKDLKYIVPVEL